MEINNIKSIESASNKKNANKLKNADGKSISEIASASKKKSAKKEIINLNLLERLGIKENAGNRNRDRGELLYNYPENWGKREIGGIEGRGFRGKCRRNILSFADRIILFREKKRFEDMKNEMQSFGKFYKEFYRKNDFDSSLFSGMQDAIDREKGKILFEICKKDSAFMQSFAKIKIASKEGDAGDKKKNAGNSSKLNANAAKRKLNKDANKKRDAGNKDAIKNFDADGKLIA